MGWLTHHAASGMGKVVESVTASALHELWSTVKGKLTGVAAKEAVQDFEQNPDDVDNQASLRKQITKAIASDSSFAAKLSDWIKKTTPHSGDIRINSSDLSLGGGGGRALGAAGGGGGAMGPGAIGGGGGPGGSVSLYGQAGMAPGAGGGGAGAIGEGVGAGDGGGGGERVIHFFLAEDLPPTVRIKLGREGRGGEEGEDGEDGENTSFGDLLHAPGGPGGRAGKARPVARQVTPVDLDQGLRVLVLSLADCVHVRNGLLNLLSAGWETYDVPRLPWNIRWPLICTLYGGSVDQHTQIAFAAIVVDPEGNKISQEEFFIHNGTGALVAMHHAVLTLRFAAACAGIWTIAITSGDFELARLPIEIRVGSWVERSETQHK
jgi:hypothetical protein